MDKVSKLANRAYETVAKPYKRLWDWNMWVAIAAPVLATIGITFSAGFVFSGLSFSDYWATLSGGANSAIATGMELKERAVWECGPGIAVCYAIQPSGWSWNDMESMKTLQTMTGESLPSAKYEWLSSLLEKPA